MAFLSYDDIRADLPKTAKQSDVVRFLAIVEAELISLGLVFAPISVGATKRFYNSDERFNQSIFDMRFISSISNVSIYNKDNTLSSTLLATDYLVSYHPRFTTKAYQIELLNRELCGNQYIQITGDVGFYLDMSDSSFDLLKSAIKTWMINRLGYASTGDRILSESKIGDNSVKYDTNSIKQVSTSFIHDDEAQAILNLYTV